jgi:FixJ family two-component response regulator
MRASAEAGLAVSVAQIAPHTASRAQGPAAPTLVLVDDDPALLHALGFAFETQGYLVRAYKDAESLLADPWRPSGQACFVLDQKLPGRTGLALIAELRARHIDAPALLITSNPTPALRHEAARAGVPIVEKPLLGHVLEEKVREALDRMF